MPKESLCLKIPKVYGEKALALASKMQLTDVLLKIKKANSHLLVPLKRQPNREELETLKRQVPEVRLAYSFFLEKEKPQKSYIELLKGKLPPHLLARLPRSFDIVGDIGILEIPQQLSKHKKVIGEAFLEANKNVRTVLAKASAVDGTYRLRNLEVIAGEPRTSTVHKEHGCKYYVDLAKAYFSPRLSHEHKRVASLVKDGEVVLDMFAGIGPFAILIAKKHPKTKVYAVDLNPDAIEFLKRNARLNRVENRVFPLLGDTKQVVEKKLCGIADRVIMNLPEKAVDFVSSACKAAKSSGSAFHFYSFVDVSASLEVVQKRFVAKVEECGRRVRALSSRFVRGTAPHEWQIVLDAEIV